MAEHRYFIGIGTSTRNAGGERLEAYYPQPLALPHDLARQLGGAQVAELTGALPALAPALEFDPELPRLYRELHGCPGALLCICDIEAAPDSVADAYLRLHLLSHRLVKPHGLSLENLFAMLPTVAWTSEGAIAVNELAGHQLRARRQRRALRVYSVDKFPALTDYLLPSGVRIADSARVRLGAYLGEGTTVMHEGFINFNAGTLGESMIEGRISSGVTVGAGSDLGGSAATMGTLSGGENIVISVGRNCLIGSNAGIGIPLGDDCIIEAGLYITAACTVEVLAADKSVVERVRGYQLAGRNALMFIRNSMTGTIQAMPNRRAVSLNESLHQHN